MTAVNDSETTYVFGPRERHALLLGMRLSQLLLVAEGAVLLLLGLLSESGAGVLLVGVCGTGLPSRRIPAGARQAARRVGAAASELPVRPGDRARAVPGRPVGDALAN